MSEATETKMEEQKAKALRVLGTMLDYLGLEAEWTTEVKGNRLIVKLTSNDAGRIIGRRGATLESLQILLNRIMFRGEEDTPMICLDIDGYSHGNVTAADRGGERKERGERGERGNDRRGGRRERGDRHDRRGGERGERNERSERGDRPGRGEDAVPEEQLRMLALDKAKEVKRWGESVELAPMNAHDRRIIHITLQDDAEIETTSDGDGAMKKVVISLKKAEN
ncbi:MAG: protein jag [Victivallaceae bacterium]|nr:R3H domain-containing nucleic acid-binding protein [Victivallaceae bacterium]